jgi:glycerol-3-phosphate acyltransferase PlsY
MLPHAARTPWAITVLFVIPLIVILKHHQNIARLMKGTEYRFGKTDRNTRTTAA